MARHGNNPRPPSDSSKSGSDAAARDATKGENEPLDVTQDPNAPPAESSAPTEGGSSLGLPSGFLDQDRDGTAETPDVGQAHAPPINPSPKPKPPGVPVPTDPNSPEYGQYGQTIRERSRTEGTMGEGAGGRAGGRVQMAGGHLETTFEADCDEIAKGVKKLTEAGMGGGEAGKLALQLWGLKNGYIGGSRLRD